MIARTESQDKTVNANGINIHYLERGDTRLTPMVLLHGLRGHGHSWDDISAAFSSHYHVFALDQRGRGETDWATDGDYSTDIYVADLEGFCQALGLDSFVLVGHSMGGRNSLLYASRHPETLQRLVVVDVGPEMDPKGSKRITQEIIDVPEEFDSFEGVIEYMSKQNRFASDAVLRRRFEYATKELPNGKIGWRYDSEIRESRRRGGTAPQVDLWPALPKITCPTLVIRGLETDVLAPDVAQKMMKELPHGQLVEVPRAGHMVFEDNPVDTITAMREFLA
jgi:pimeloyl-ACP methyl ester carboxylesterase